jgi:ESF2/ABP1 family protein
MSGKKAKAADARFQLSAEMQEDSASEESEAEESEEEGSEQEGSEEEVSEDENEGSGDESDGGEEGSGDEDEGEKEEEKETKPDKKAKKSKMHGDAVSFSDKLAMRGVVYMGRVPPFMKPNKLRSMLERYGEITRLFLQEEDITHRKKRVANGGNGSKQFVEGWIEFEDKKIAKYVARSLHATLMGGKKRNFYHDDMWNLKYLRGFRWDHLTEKFAYERRVREAKMRASMIESKKKNAEFVTMVEQNKAESHIKNRIKKRKADAGGEAAPVADGDGGGAKKKQRTFRQSQSLGRHHGENETSASSRLLKNVFSS